MSNAVKRSELAEQIELARQSIDRWPGWLKDAAGVQTSDAIESESPPQQADSEMRPALADHQG